MFLQKESFKKGKNLEVVLSFNFTNNVSPYVNIANIAYYKNFFSVLREHENIRVNLTFNGNILQTLQWYSPETIELIKEGINAKQFFIVRFFKLIKF